MIVDHAAIRRRPDQEIAAKGAEGGADEMKELILVVRLDEAAFGDEPDEQAHRESAAAEAETVDAVAVPIVAAEVGVERPARRA